MLLCHRHEVIYGRRGWSAMGASLLLRVFWGIKFKTKTLEYMDITWIPHNGPMPDLGTLEGAKDAASVAPHQAHHHKHPPL